MTKRPYADPLRLSSQCLVLLFLFSGAQHPASGQDRATIVSMIPAGPRFVLPGFNSGPVVRQNSEQVSSQTGVDNSWLREYRLLSFQSFEKSGGVVAQAFEMLDPPGAYGLFTQLSSTVREAGNLGDGSSFAEDSLTFWKGNYFFRLLGAPASVLQPIADKLAGQVPHSAEIPTVAKLLPQDGLDAGSVRFFVGKLLPSDGKISEIYSRLKLENSVEAAIGRYGERGDRLIILGYPTRALALQSFESIQDYVADKSHAMYAKRAGAILALTEQMPREEALALLGKVEYTPMIKWIVDKQKNARRSGGGVKFLLNAVVGSLALSGLFVLGTAVLGAGFGMARCYMRRAHPDNFFDRPERVQMVRLKLVDR